MSNYDSRYPSSAPDCKYPAPIAKCHTCFKCDQVINGEILNHDGREDTGQFIYVCEACAEVGARNIDLSRLPYGSIENVGRTWDA